MTVIQHPQNQLCKLFIFNFYKNLFEINDNSQNPSPT